MASWLMGAVGEGVRGVNANAPSQRASVALKVGPLFDGSRTRAPAINARSLRPVFVVFMGLSLAQMLCGGILSSERSDLPAQTPPTYGARQDHSAPPAP